jgi:signal transduction histidine kinase
MPMPGGRIPEAMMGPGSGPEGEEDFLAQARLPGAVSFWIVQARTVSGTVVDLARSKARLLWWGIVLTAVTAIGAIVALLAWARRRSRLANLQTDFVANVTHELKTPLTGIRSLAETLQFGRITSPERAGEFVGAIVRETDRLARLINNVLDFSRLERGTARLRLERTDLAELVRSTVEAFKASLGDDDGGRIIVETPAEGVPAVVDADSMSRAVTNLLDNAWKYSRPPREIRASLAAADGRATISVSDNGIGIPAAQHRKIFRKFYRVDSSLSAETQGAGLGLSLVKAYAEAHGGRVDLQAKPGEGSTFTITVPLAPDDAQG